VLVVTDRKIPGAYVFWCAVIKYDKKESFKVGTLKMPAGSRYHEIEQGFRELTNKHLPEGYRILSLECGSLFFVKGDTEVPEK
jgi:hypothetical protein